MVYTDPTQSSGVPALTSNKGSVLDVQRDAYTELVPSIEVYRESLIIQELNFIYRYLEFNLR